MTPPHALAAHWPLFGLKITTPRLELRYPTDEDLGAVVEVAARGINEPGRSPFKQPWADAPPGQLEPESLRYFWGLRSAWRPNDWNLPLAVVEGGTVVGIQSVFARNFAVLRDLTSGSWLGRPYQGRGIGREMRSAVIHLAFAGLGAERVLSGAFEDNQASLGVSRALGYRANGDEMWLRHGARGRIVRLVLARSEWQERGDISIEGLDAALPMFLG
ncbi:MAG: GNAT family N-acetyltransferase [Candidatus Dormibacteria bacterium]